jgi:hypothetical protein
MFGGGCATQKQVPLPDFKTIADFLKDNGEAICKVCREFVVLCPTP